MTDDSAAKWRAKFAADDAFKQKQQASLDEYQRRLDTKLYISIGYKLHRRLCDEVKDPVYTIPGDMHWASKVRAWTIESVEAIEELKKRLEPLGVIIEKAPDGAWRMVEKRQG